MSVAHLKLGKRAAKHDRRTMMLSKYTTLLAPPPASVDYESKVKTWPMMMNDKIGDCAIATPGHQIEQWTTYTNNPFIPTDEQIVEAYSAITGYDPSQTQPDGSNPTDNGSVVLDVLKYWRKTGIANHKIKAFMGLRPGHDTELMDSIALFGNAYLGVALPQSAQDQDGTWYVAAGGPSVPENQPGSWGGHAIPAVAYDSRTIWVITWGRLWRMTWNFYNTYCDEAYAILSTDWLNRGNIAVSGIAMSTLLQDLQVITAA